MEFDPTQTISNTLGTAIVARLAASLSYLVGISIKRKEWQFALRKEHIDRYRKLSTDFLSEFNKLTLMGLETKTGDLNEFFRILQLYAEIEIFCSQTVQDSAKSLCDIAITSHSVSFKGIWIHLS